MSISDSYYGSWAVLTTVDHDKNLTYDFVLSEIFMELLGDNDRAARVLFIQHPREQGEWCSQNPSVVKVLT